MANCASRMHIHVTCNSRRREIPSVAASVLITAE
jgi:hypothetical protein